MATEVMGGLSTDALDSDDDFGGIEGDLRKPPIYLRYIGFISIFIGLSIGIFGARTRGNTQQYLLGGIGYVLTAIVPIVLLQIVHLKHDFAQKAEDESSYDIFAGKKLTQQFRSQIVPLGLLFASLPIWVLLSPIAEKLA